MLFPKGTWGSVLLIKDTPVTLFNSWWPETRVVNTFLKIRGKLMSKNIGMKNPCPDSQSGLKYVKYLYFNGLEVLKYTNSYRLKPSSGCPDTTGVQGENMQYYNWPLGAFYNKYIIENGRDKVLPHLSSFPWPVVAWHNEQNKQNTLQKKRVSPVSYVVYWLECTCGCLYVNLTKRRLSGRT